MAEERVPPDIKTITVKALNQAIKRNILRFPEDFMFQLTKDEKERWSQFVTTLKH